MTKPLKTMVSIEVSQELSRINMENTPGTDPAESTRSLRLLLPHEDLAPIWSHKASALRRAANMLNAMADNIEQAQTAA